MLKLLVRRARRLIAAVVLCAGCASLVACKAQNAAQGVDATPTTTVPKAVAKATVVKAVRAATRLDRLPASITNADLLAASGDDESAWSVPGCTPGLETTSLGDLTPCTLGDVDADRSMIVIGDSAAAMWHGALDLIGKRAGWRVTMLTKNNCGPAELVYYQWQLERDFTECDEWQKWRTDVIQEQRPDIVVMAGWYGGNLGPDRVLNADVWRNGLVKAVKKMPKSTKVLMLGNQPHPEGVPSECAARNKGSLRKCALPEAEAVPDQSGWSRAAKAVGGKFVDVTPWFCSDTCPPVIANHLVYAGKYHITTDYGRYLSGSIQAAIATWLR